MDDWHAVENVFGIIIQYLVTFTEAYGALIIVLEASRVLITFLRRFFGYNYIDVSTMRLRLGQSMVMALEFLVAADILKSILSPTWDDLLKLAALIVLRTVLNFLLEREMENIHCYVPPDGMDDQFVNIPISVGQGEE